MRNQHQLVESLIVNPPIELRCHGNPHVGQEPCLPSNRQNVHGNVSALNAHATTTEVADDLLHEVILLRLQERLRHMFELLTHGPPHRRHGALGRHLPPLASARLSQHARTKRHAATDDGESHEEERHVHDDAPSKLPDNCVVWLLLLLLLRADLKRQAAAIKEAGGAHNRIRRRRHRRRHVSPLRQTAADRCASRRDRCTRW
mmetsp:Transcript_92356/g.266619  ORF Transcript_92356/g.266619 Transcript_92356/m.266619 type:complete len:203 (-) Transcript_92356:68-676(-)